MAAKTKKTPVPKSLSKEARLLWEKFMKGWHFDDASSLILEGALQQLDRARSAQASIAKDGIWIQDRYGGAKANPAIAIERDALGAMTRALHSLGLKLAPPADIYRGGEIR